MFRDGMKLPKIVKAMNTAQAAFNAGQDDIARRSINDAYNMLLDTTIARTPLIMLIAEWGLMGITLKEHGHSDLSDQCTNMSKLLQARFDAGDYYREV